MVIVLSSLGERAPSSTETKTKIGDRKRGIPQSEAHLQARKEGRKPKFVAGDKVTWFDEEGVVVRFLGISSAYGDGRQALWYRVRFGDQTRELVQEVLSKI